MSAVLKLLALYWLTLPVFFVIDMFWLGIVARGFYRRQFGNLLAPQFNWTAAVAFYLLFIAGILVFAVAPGLKRESLTHAVMLGALFGLISYATYDLTNLATLRGWPLPLTIVDMLWGALLSALVSAASFMIGKKFLGI